MQGQEVVKSGEVNLDKRRAFSGNVWGLFDVFTKFYYYMVILAFPNLVLI